MTIAIILGSQRKNRKCSEIEDCIKKYKNHNYYFIKMSEIKIDGCIDCQLCSKTGKCEQSKVFNDMFEETLDKLVKSDIILFITPIYAPYPSRLIALIERLFSISFYGYINNKIEKPLINKKVGIFCYGSSKIEDDKI
jgi:multimeric flavodoxin WrbA